MGLDLRELRLTYGLTQTAVARAAGMHQPDLSAIERGRPTTTAGYERLVRAIGSLVRPSAVLEEHRDEVHRVLRDMGARNPRVFGSVLHGTDRPGSDVDLLVTLPEDMTLFGIARIENALTAVLGVPVDVVPDDDTSPALRTARAEARPL